MSYIVTTQQGGQTLVRTPKDWENQTHIDFSRQDTFIGFSSPSKARYFAEYLKDSEPDCKNKALATAQLLFLNNQWTIIPI